MSNQSGGVGIEDGTNVAKSSDVVLTGLENGRSVEAMIEELKRLKYR